MELKIFPNWFAPKVKNENQMIHGIYNKECNFRCSFCSQNKRESYLGYKKYDIEKFEIEVIKLLKESNLFKFTGGEPTMLPEIRELIKVVNKHNGKVFLDTNASRKALIKEMIDDKQIRVLGVSIKGLTPLEAMEKSGNRCHNLCWDNVIEVCNYAYGKAEVILTYVVDSNTTIENLISFCRGIVDGEVNVDYLKLNNLYGTDLPDHTLSAVKNVEFLKICEEIVNVLPEMKNHLIAISSLEAVRNKGSILYY